MTNKMILISYNEHELRSIVSEYIAATIRKELNQALTKTQQSQILTRHEAAKILNVSLPTLHAYTKRGLIKTFRLGNAVRYKLSDLEAALVEIKVKF